MLRSGLTYHRQELAECCILHWYNSHGKCGRRSKVECSQSDTCDGIQLEKTWKYGSESRCNTTENCKSLRDIQETKRHITGNTYVETVHFTALASQEAAQAACGESDFVIRFLNLETEVSLQKTRV